MKLEEIKKFQEGGSMPTQPAPVAADQAATGEQDPILAIAEVFIQGLQNQDCALLTQGAEAFLAMVQEMSGTQPPVGQAPEGQPVFKKGGKLVGYAKGKKVMKKSNCK